MSKTLPSSGDQDRPGLSRTDDSLDDKTVSSETQQFGLEGHRATPVKADERRSTLSAWRRTLTASVHDSTLSNLEVIVNLSILPLAETTPGTVFCLRSPRKVSGERVTSTQAWEPSKRDALLHSTNLTRFDDAYLFRVRTDDADFPSQSAQHEISVSEQLAKFLGLVNGSRVELSAPDESSCCASHVEIVFRDQYLARSDMWRLVNAELAGKCLRRGQKLNFMDSVKAAIKTVFVQGHEVSAGFFDSSTKPVFRSESARYVIFIQLSKEMWDFDSAGSGEIMFDKLVNGFLPDLFKRWQQQQVHHLVSIVLFSKVIYASHCYGESDPNSNLHDPEVDSSGQARDFYRVVASDMGSGEWTAILEQLKREFKVYQRDTLIQKGTRGQFAPLGSDLSNAVLNVPGGVIAGHSSEAAYGNVLEAINLASSQFSSDYIDRDLIRTGVSIILISAGTGLHEVDGNLLKHTTDNLIDNGVGIDLVCLSPMPLHSVPLFKYCQLQGDPSPGKHRNDAVKKIISADESLAWRSSSSISPSQHESKQRQDLLWSFGIPHWIDVSFWTDREQVRPAINSKKSWKNQKAGEKTRSRKLFSPRVRMYEVQMMGHTENTDTQVCIPSLDLRQADTRKRSSGLNALRSPRRDQLDRYSRSASDNEIEYFVHANNSSVSKPSKVVDLTNIGFRPLITDVVDDYDEALFRHPRATRKRRHRMVSRTAAIDKSRIKPRIGYAGYKKSKLSTQHHADQLQPSNLDTQRDSSVSQQQSSQQQQSMLESASESKARKRNPTPRSISFGLKGFTPSSKAVASAKLDSTQSSTWTSRLNVENPRIVANPDAQTSTSASSEAAAHTSPVIVQYSDTESTTLQSSDSEHQAYSKPIPIKRSFASRNLQTATSRKERGGGRVKPATYDRVAALTDLIDEEPPSHGTESKMKGTLTPSDVLSPQTALAPWLTILNPSNPSRVNELQTSRIGRWQHIFPQPPKASQVKWKSLCSPAAVPLTTEDFPTADQLSEEYKETSYTIILSDESDVSERPRSTVHELIAVRLSRGFQIVVGDRVREAQTSELLESIDVFNERLLTQSGASVVLSQGSLIHVLTRTGLDRVQVRILRRHSTDTTSSTRESANYSPVIRSRLSDAYETQSISLVPHCNPFEWDLIDSFVVGGRKLQAAQYVEGLRPWRARFLLIPVEIPANARHLTRSNEDNDEEVRLEGLKRLTQAWQKYRFVPSKDRSFQPRGRKTKDPNPLDIIYTTKNPSAVVAAEHETVLEGEETGQPIQLLAESDLFQRSNLNLKVLSETIQSDKGVRMQDRRWHLRLHFNCFIGADMTSWLLQNFRDVASREEAEALGNDLMKNGLFKHVEHRHNFRDGNYFYQIESEYRTPRPESRGWFGRGKSSVPSTPLTDRPPEPSPVSRSRASSGADKTSGELQPTPVVVKKSRPSVALSKCLLFDVDHRKRSYRSEVVNLHYDRIHNPDNCYHFRIDWVNTTSRLIQENIASWTATVERFGLRLVEVPIGEASSITSTHPFRAPHTIELALQPPTTQPQQYLDSSSFLPQSQLDPLFYQRTILRAFDFVLDCEAASAFPPDVDVTYSWGKTSYQYDQYIHRSGVLIAQITPEGHFIVLANRLYNSRASPSTPAVSKQDLHKASTTHASTQRPPSHDGPMTPNIPRSSPYQSPFSSPATRATLDVPTPVAPISNTDKRHTASTSPSPSPSGTTSHMSHHRPSTAKQAPEALTAALQTFCHDAVALEAFYSNLIDKTSSSTPSSGTPVITPAKSPGPSFGADEGPGTSKRFAKTPLRKVDSTSESSNTEDICGKDEDGPGIPILELPGSLVER